MKIQLYCFLLPFFFLTAFDRKVQQRVEMSYYRPDIGMYIKYNKRDGKKKFAFKENWDFFFSLKNDSVAIIQEIKNKTLLTPKEYKISLSIDTGYVKRYLNGKHHETEKFYFRKIYM